jgi:hypothetical protein
MQGANDAVFRVNISPANDTRAERHVAKKNHPYSVEAIVAHPTTHGNVLVGDGPSCFVPEKCTLTTYGYKQGGVGD